MSIRVDRDILKKAIGLPEFFIRPSGEGGFAYEDVLDGRRYVVIVIHPFSTVNGGVEVFLTRKFSPPYTYECYAKSSLKKDNLDNWLCALEDCAGLRNAIGFVNRVATNTVRCDNVKDAVHTYTDITLDPTVVHKYKIEWTTASIKYYVDDSLKATHTTNIPTVPLIPFIEQWNGSGVALDSLYPLYGFGGVI